MDTLPSEILIITIANVERTDRLNLRVVNQRFCHLTMACTFRAVYAKNTIRGSASLLGLLSSERIGEHNQNVDYVDRYVLGESPKMLPVTLCLGDRLHRAFIHRDDTEIRKNIITESLLLSSTLLMLHSLSFTLGDAFPWPPASIPSSDYSLQLAVLQSSLPGTLRSLNLFNLIPSMHAAFSDPTFIKKFCRLTHLGLGTVSILGRPNPVLHAFWSTDNLSRARICADALTSLTLERRRRSASGIFTSQIYVPWASPASYSTLERAPRRSSRDMRARSRFSAFASAGSPFRPPKRRRSTRGLKFTGTSRKNCARRRR